MKKFFRTIPLFFFLTILFFTANAGSAATFNDCEGDYVTVSFDQKTQSLNVTITTDKETEVRNFEKLILGWHYSATQITDTVTYNHMYRTDKGDAYAAILYSESWDKPTGNAGISLDPAMLIIKKEGNKMTFSIPLNKEQLAHLKGAGALNKLETPRVWLHN